MKKIKINRENAGKLVEAVKKLGNGGVKSIIFSFEKPEADKEVSLGVLSKELSDAVDECISQDISVRIENIPYCFLVGYKRYVFEAKSSEKTKPKKCTECKYFDECSGIWKDYIKLFGTKEIAPITGKFVITDNERCMISILLKKATATTKELLELKNSDEFKDICAHCVGSDDVMLTGGNLMNKGIVKRRFAKRGFVWSVQRNHFLVKKMLEEIQ